MAKYDLGILNEKPSQARNFAKALGGMTGTYNGVSYIIVPARGHLYEFEDPSKQVAPDLVRKYHTWNVENLPWNENDFSWKKKPKPDTADTLASIKSALSQCDEIAIATDDDPTGEGELLAWEILDALKFHPKKWSRLYFDDESEKSIQKAFVNRKPIQSMLTDMDYVKADYRSKWDFMSMQWTRIATAFGDGHSVLRQGRLKSAMVLIVGQQLDAIKNYKKVPFYQNKFRDENGVVYTNPEEPVYKTKEEVPQTYTDSPVVLDSKTMKSTPPRKLLDLASLSALLAPKGFKAKDVLAVYQKMYEAQVVSYPRTEDKCITPEQFNDLLPKVDKICAVVGVDPALLTHRTPRSTHVKTGMAHGANRPGPNVPNSLQELTKYGACGPAIYETLAKNYLAIMAEDYEYEAQKGHVEKYPKFTGTASVPKKAGWKAVFSDVDDVGADDNNKGIGTHADPFVYEGFPPKPANPTMKWLMKQLEKHDVGTGATRTSIYADVTNAKTKYPLLSESRGKISMTEYGDMSYLLLGGTHIGDLQMTEDLMKQMKDISQHKADPEVCLHGIQDLIRDDIPVMQANGIEMRAKLGKQMYRPADPSDYYECDWNSKKDKFKKIWSGHTFTDDECVKLAAGETIEIEAVSSKSGNPFKCRGHLEESTYKGRKYLGFKCLEFVNDGKPHFGNGVPASWCGHKFTAAEKKKLEDGKAIKVKGCVSKKTGKTFDCTLEYKDDGSGQKRIVPSFK